MFQISSLVWFHINEDAIAGIGPRETGEGMRITGGTHRSRALSSPGDRSIRPTSDKVRKAMFDILDAQIRDARFLDCYAGTGAVGLEALSRGAASSTLVEKDRKALALIRRNAENLCLKIELIPGDFTIQADRLARKGRMFDLVFIDPPYGTDQQIQAIEKIQAVGLLDPDGTVIVEHDKRMELPVVIGILQRRFHRRYGETDLSFFEYTG